MGDLEPKGTKRKGSQKSGDEAVTLQAPARLTLPSGGRLKSEKSRGGYGVRPATRKGQFQPVQGKRGGGF